MILRRTLATLLGALMLLAGLTVASQAAAKETIEAGTIAPKKSPWGKVFRAWSKALKKKTKGELELKWYFGTQGDEGNLVSKMQSKQLDAAAVTSVGLSKIHFPMLILQSPGLFTDWDKLDAARETLWSEFQAGANSNGFALLGAGDVGKARTMSKGKAIRLPEDLQNMKVYAWDQDKVAPVIASVIGYTPVKVSVPGLLPALSGGRINVATVPCLAATQLQWWSHLDHVNTSAVATVIGGLVIRKEKLDGLPADIKEQFIKSAKKAGKMLTKRIRKEDKKAYGLIKKRMTVVKLKRKEKKVWRKKFREIRKRLAQGVFEAELMARVESLAGK